MACLKKGIVINKGEEFPADRWCGCPVPTGGISSEDYKKAQREKNKAVSVASERLAALPPGWTVSATLRCTNEEEKAKREKTIDSLWETSNHGTRREDIESAYNAGAMAVREGLIALGWTPPPEASLHTMTVSDYFTNFRTAGELKRFLAGVPEDACVLIEGSAAEIVYWSEGSVLIVSA